MLLLIVPLSPHKRISQVSESCIKQALIEVFQQWGQPKSIKVDNGKPIGDPQRKSIPQLALWLTGLGIEVIFNRPRRPTDNAVVERMQQTTRNWAEVKTAANLQQLKQRLEQVRRIQRQLYPVPRLGGKTRIETFPQLLQKTKVYCPVRFDTNRVYQKLSQFTFVSFVSAAGQFILYNQIYYLTLQHKKQYVIIKFDPDQILWHVYDDNNNFIDALPAINLENKHFISLTVCQRTFKKDRT